MRCMVKMIGELFSLAFYFFEDTVDAIPISSATHLKSESYPGQHSLEMRCAINQKRRLLNLLFL